MARGGIGGPIARGELVAVCARDSWAPVAVGRFSKSNEDMVLEGSRGAARVLLRVGDGVWPNTAVDESTASSSPPEFCVAAAAAAAESAADAPL